MSEAQARHDPGCRRPSAIPAAHLALKEAARAKLKYEGAKRTRFRPNDRLLAFLEAL
jgi:hypothetical protein